MGQGSIYTYGVIEQEPLQLEVQGVGGADEVYTVDHRPFSAVVSDIDAVDPEQTDENLHAHSDVLQEVLLHDGGRSVVPMQFGMVFSGAGTVKNVLRGSRPAFRRALSEIDGAVELGLKVVREEEAPVDIEAVERAIEDRFDPLARSVAENDIFSDRLLANRAYLVDRADREAFDTAVDEFDEEHDELEVQYTGPWAPFNFVEINIGAKA